MNPEANIFDEKIKGIQNSFFSALDDFKNGVYFVYLQSNGKMVTNKFLVQH